MKDDVDDKLIITNCGVVADCGLEAGVDCCAGCRGLSGLVADDD